MGFKQRGFPSASFNFPGFKANIHDLIPNHIECLLFATNPNVLDRVGKTTYEPLRPACIKGDGSTYFDLGAMDYDGRNFEYERRFVYKTTNTTFLAIGASGREGLAIDVLGSSLRVFGYLAANPTIRSISSPFTLDTEYKVKVKLEELVIKVYVDDVLILTDSFPSTRNQNGTCRFMSRISGINVSDDDIVCEIITDSSGNKFTYNPQCLQLEGGSYVDYIVPYKNNQNTVNYVAQQVNQPAIPIVYKDTLVISHWNELGGTISDGTQYIDNAQAELYDTGYYIPQNQGFNASGDLITQQNIGRVKYNPRVIQGVVDCNDVNVGWTVTDATIADNQIKFTGDSNFKVAAFELVSEVSDNQTVTIAFDVDKNTLIGIDKFALSSSSITGTTIYLNGIGDDRYFYTFTTANPITSNRIRFVQTNTAGVGEDIFISNIKLYEGTITSENEPYWIDNGNQLVFKEGYDRLVKADSGDYLYDDTDPDNVVPKIIEISDINNGDYFFMSATKHKVAVYETAQTGDNLVRILKDFGL